MGAQASRELSEALRDTSLDELITKAEVSLQQIPKEWILTPLLVP